jgi:hypothetical protein
VIAVAHILLRFLAGLLRMIVLSVRQGRSLEAENLYLRRRLTLYKEKGMKPRRIDAATPISLVFVSRLFDWRDAVVVVRSETLIRWHRAGGIAVALKCRPTPADSTELRQFIGDGDGEPAGGEERIANELPLKLGVRVSPEQPASMPKRPAAVAPCVAIFRNHQGDRMRLLGLSQQHFACSPYLW